VKTLVQKLESGGPEAGPPAQPHGSSQPHGPVSQRAEGRLAECVPGVHVTVLRGRDFSAHADVGSYVCLSTLSNDANVAELAIGAPPRSPPAPASLLLRSALEQESIAARRSCHSRSLCALQITTPTRRSRTPFTARTGRLSSSCRHSARE